MLTRQLALLGALWMGCVSLQASESEEKGAGPVYTANSITVPLVPTFSVETGESISGPSEEKILKEIQREIRQQESKRDRGENTILDPSKLFRNKSSDSFIKRFQAKDNTGKLTLIQVNLDEEHSWEPRKAYEAISEGAGIKPITNYGKLNPSGKKNIEIKRGDGTSARLTFTKNAAVALTIYEGRPILKIAQGSFLLIETNAQSGSKVIFKFDFIDKSGEVLTCSCEDKDKYETQIRLSFECPVKLEGGNHKMNDMKTIYGDSLEKFLMHYKKEKGNTLAIKYKGLLLKEIIDKEIQLRLTIRPGAARVTEIPPTYTDKNVTVSLEPAFQIQKYEERKQLKRGATTMETKRSESDNTRPEDDQKFWSGSTKKGGIVKKWLGLYNCGVIKFRKETNADGSSETYTTPEDFQGPLTHEGKLNPAGDKKIEVRWPGPFPWHPAFLEGKATFTFQKNASIALSTDLYPIISKGSKVKIETNVPGSEVKFKFEFIDNKAVLL